jgi:hypothetical protein
MRKSVPGQRSVAILLELLAGVWAIPVGQMRLRCGEVTQTPESRARRYTTQKERIRADRNWEPSKEFEWLDRRTYISKIQRGLAGMTIPAIQSALGVGKYSPSLSGCVSQQSCLNRTNRITSESDYLAFAEFETADKRGDQAQRAAN